MTFWAVTDQRYNYNELHFVKLLVIPGLFMIIDITRNIFP